LFQNGLEAKRNTTAAIIPRIFFSVGESYLNQYPVHLAKAVESMEATQWKKRLSFLAQCIQIVENINNGVCWHWGPSNEKEKQSKDKAPLSLYQ
jgi:hypothetical protein